MNIEKAADILIQLKKQGVSTLCLCPGARNAPFVKLLSEINEFEVIPFFDERSAGFFALGRARRDLKPVVICTTSGTAVSELLSPVIEAFYSNTPLIVLSADRPKRLRGTGAPQTIHQSHLFNEHVEKSFDFAANEDFVLSMKGDKPIHINVCFDEPLIDLNEVKLKERILSTKLLLSEIKFNHQHGKTLSSKENIGSGDFGDQVKPHINSSKPCVLSNEELVNLLEKNEFSLVVCGALKESQRLSVENFLAKYEGPVFAESLSGLKNSVLLKNKMLKSGERIVCEMIKKGEIKSVLRLGDIPVGRYWRDFDLFNRPVTNISDKEFSGLNNSQTFCNSLENLSSVSFSKPSKTWQMVKERDEEQSEKLKLIIKEFPLSEVSLMAKLSEKILNNDLVYLGNSLPVRQWDLISQEHNNVFASRGVNGIDGQLSTAMGLHNSNQATWAILGDLTTLYDFSGFWLTSYLKKIESPFHLVVINNKGGQIFSRLFKENLFLNEHDLEFSHLAKMWGWNYVRSENSLDMELTSNFNLIELLPQPEQTKLFWEKYDLLWKI